MAKKRNWKPASDEQACGCCTKPVPTKPIETANRTPDRARQACIAAILDRTFGALGESNPALWERRTYLMLIGLVYVKLARDAEGIPTDELIALAKVLAENRRANARTGESQEEDKPGASLRAESPGEFADTIRAVFGIDVPKAPKSV